MKQLFLATADSAPSSARFRELSTLVCKVPFRRHPGQPCIPLDAESGPGGAGGGFTVPIRVQTLEVSSDQAAPGGAPPRKRILLVDDDPTVRESLHDVLVEEGYIVIPASNGQEAIELAAGGPFDLVLLDLNMPVKNGWDTFERLTAQYPMLPIIIATARPNQFFTALSAGVGALLEKPLDIPTLLRCIARLLAEPAEIRLARLAGHATDFYYAAGQAKSLEEQKNKNH